MRFCWKCSRYRLGMRLGLRRGVGLCPHGRLDNTAQIQGLIDRRVPLVIPPGRYSTRTLTFAERKQLC